MTMTNEIDPTKPTNPNRYDELSDAQRDAIDRLINAIASHPQLVGTVDMISSTIVLVHHAGGFGSDR